LANGNEEGLSDKDGKAIQLMRLVLTDYYTNCMKSVKVSELNERTPFVDHLVPLFKCYSACYPLIFLEWCEKGLLATKILRANLSDMEDIPGLSSVMALPLPIIVKGSSLNHQGKDAYKLLD
jgi:hypothetical protein